jgi:hypothetical protein
VTEPARRAGVVLQALLLGTGLFLVLIRLLQVATDAQVFRYQQF